MTIQRHTLCCLFILFSIVVLDPGCELTISTNFQSVGKLAHSHNTRLQNAADHARVAQGNEDLSA
jgi:hypothetical protein